MQGSNVPMAFRSIAMKIGILYNIVESTDYGKDIDIMPDSEIGDPVQSILSVLKDDNEVIPIRVSRNAIQTLRRRSFDLIFNLCEGLEEDSKKEPWIPGFLDLLEIPYTGSDSFTLGLCMNKIRTKHMLVANDIPTPKYQKFVRKKQSTDPELNYPLFVKPAMEDGSLGISMDSLVNNRAELEVMVERILKNFHQPALVEEFIDGRELNVSIIGNGNKLEVLPISEITFDFEKGQPNIVSYQAKWCEGTDVYNRTTGVCPADLPPDIERRVKKAALDAYKATGCRDYARVDIRLRDGVPYVLEVNPNPWIYLDGGFVRSANAAGYPYKQIIERIVQEALKRYRIDPMKTSRATDEAYMTDNLILKPVKYENLDLISKWYNELEVNKGENGFDVHSYSEDNLIDKYFISGHDDFDLLMLERSDGREIGVCSLENINPLNKSAEISFLIGDKDSQGKGYGKESAELLLGIAFDRMKLENLITYVTATKDQTKRVLELTGFRKAGILREYQPVDGGKADVIIYQMSRREYRQRVSNSLLRDFINIENGVPSAGTTQR